MPPPSPFPGKAGPPPANAWLAALIESSDDAIISRDLNGIVQSWNHGAERIFGYTAEEMVGTSIRRLIPTDRPDEEDHILGRIHRGEKVVNFETRRQTKAGTLIDVSLTTSPIHDAAGQIIGASKIARDITQARQRDAEIIRLSRLYTALSQVNQAIVASASRDDLLPKVCRVLVEHGKFLLAWIGWEDPETRRLVPVAVWGAGSDYVRQITIYTDDRPEGRGPAGRTFREGRPVVTNDLVNDRTLALWLAEIKRYGLRASAAFPIRQQGRVCAVLNVYAGEAGFFRDKEIALLAEAAADLSFGLDNFLRNAERQRAETLARHEKNFSDAMIDSMPGILYFYDEQGRFLRWNRNFETVSGYSAAEIATMTPLDFFPAAERALLQGRIAEVFTQGEAQVEATFVAKDGSARPYFFTGRRVALDQRQCLVGVGIDMSARKQAEQALRASEERYRTTLDNILEGCQLIGFDWRYLYLNEAAAGHNRRPNAELLGRTMPEAWPGIEASPVFRLLRRCMEERRALHEETEFTFPDGSRAWFDVRSQPVPEGIFVLSIDISERHEAEQALRLLNESLEQKVAERTREVQAALERAESADRLKSAFLATMSHELRTPLNSIIGFTGIVLQGLAGPLNPEQTKQLGMVRGSARHLLELINDVLDISKIEAGQLQVNAEPFDAAAAIERVTALIKPQAERKGLALTTRLPPDLPLLVSDRRRFEQILLNLLNNAVKFTEHGGVTLTAAPVGDFRPAPAAPPAPALRLTVADTGIGIKPADLGRLLQPFRQIDSGLTRHHEGTGLGLAICARLCSLLHGEIVATSEWTKGSQFTVTLPLLPPPPP
jgi:PAS domain S-box-containing protein